VQMSELPDELTGHPSLKLSVDKKAILDLARHDDFQISGTHSERKQHVRFR
jgi:hypothetical protein